VYYYMNVSDLMFVEQGVGYEYVRMHPLTPEADGGV
jgi:hypothetical protein